MSDPPGFLMTWMASRSARPFRRMIASTASAAKCSFSPVRILDDSVVRATFVRWARSNEASPLWSKEPDVKAASAACAASR